MTEPAHAPRPVITRKDVARYAGVSSAVVSYVVNSGPGRVAPATKARVLEAIQVLGYQPNATARALKMGSSKLLGLIVPDNSNPLFAELARQIEISAAQRGYALLLANSNGELTEERRHLRHFASYQVDGILLASNYYDPEASRLASNGLPTVLLSQAQPIEGTASLGVDLRTGARLGIEHLISHGHKNIALIIGSGAGTEPDGREKGWEDALAAAGLPEGPLFREPFTREGGYLGAQRLLEARPRPTAVFCSNDLQAIGLLRALHEHHLSAPRDLAVVSFDGSAESEYSCPALTTLRQPLQEMAEAAVSAVASAAGRDAGHQVFPARLIVRESCGCIT